MSDLARRLVAEGVGTALLLAAVVGSGIAAERLAGDEPALALLANALATGGALVALIVIFGPVSGAHFNPAVTLALARRAGFSATATAGYVLAQLTGAVLGVWLAHLMFAEPILQASVHVRTGIGQWTGEAVATFALVAVVLACAAGRAEAAPWAVACVIVAGYWFTSSTSFANPAVTVARALTDSFAGIRGVDVAPFVAAQAVGAAAAAWLHGWLRAPAAGPAARRGLG
jgi:glycerol uptake facilitator-like aquaporin